jgi:hypothetical protein
MNIMYNILMTMKERMTAVIISILKLSESRNNRSYRTMVKATATKKSRLMNHLAKGNDITPKQAFSRYGVKNLRATMSNIKTQVEKYNNWEVTTRTLDNGATCYGMEFNGYTDNPFAIRAGLV